MTETLQRRSEILKLSALLRVVPGDLDYLATATSEDLHRLRGQVTEKLSEGYGRRYRRLISLSGHLPAGWVARAAEAFVDPMLAAQIAQLLDPDRATDLARRLEPTYLADVAGHLNLARTSEIVARLPCNVTGTVAIVLSTREDFVTLGRFITLLPARNLEATYACLPDIALLRTAFVLEDKDQLEDLVRLLPPDRRRGIIDAARDSQLWPETLDLLGHLAPDTQAEMVNLAAADPRTLDSLRASADEHDLWEDILPLVGLLDEENERVVAARLASRGHPLVEGTI
jgi:hypothetical protein